MAGSEGTGWGTRLSVMLYPRPYSDFRASGDPTHMSRPWGERLRVSFAVLVGRECSKEER